MNIKWDAEKYTKDFSFVNAYGSALLDMISGQGLKVLDMGCGNGTLTKALCDHGFMADGMDASEDLLAKARSTYPEIHFIHADATEFQIEGKYDVVFSNAVLHWIDKSKQSRMLRNVYRTLKSGGQL